MTWLKKILRPDWFLALLITGVAVGLHGYFLFHAGGFWRDEVNLINLARGSSFHALSQDSFPVLMPLLVHGWRALVPGPGETDLRLLGALIGLGIPAALWLAAWKIRRSPPLPGLALVALNGIVIVFGDSLRAYGLGSLTILLATAAAAWFLEKPSWSRAGIWAALAILSVQALYQNAVFVAAIGVGTWAVCLRQKLWQSAIQVLLVGLAAAASLLPYLSNFLSLPAAAASLRTGIDPGRLLGTFDTAAGFPLEQSRWLWAYFALVILGLGGAAFFPTAKARDNSLPEKTGGSLWPPTWITTLVAAAGFLWFAAAPARHWCVLPLLALAGWFLDRRRGSQAGADAGVPTFERDLPLFAGTTLLAAAAGFAGFLWCAALPTEPWYFVPLLALAAVCFELGLPVRGHGRAAVLGLSLITVVLAFNIIFIDRKVVNERFTNLDLLCPRLLAQAGPDDFIIVSPWYCGISFERYFHGAARWQTAPPLSDHSCTRYDLVHEQMKLPHVAQPLMAKAEATLRAGHHVWLVGMMAIPAPGVPLPADLPPPPLPHSGWSDRPYTETWVMQVNQFLSNHSSEFKMVYDTPAENLNFMENLQLYRVEGWHD